MGGAGDPTPIIHRPGRGRGRDLLPIALLGIGQFGILVALLNYSLAFITSARAGLIFALMPLVFSDADMDVMRRVKVAWDQHGLCNPGKVLPMPGACVDVAETRHGKSILVGW